MTFTSFDFAILLALTFIFYHAVEKRYRKSILLLSSCIFIGFHSLYFLVTAIAISSVTYWAGIQLSKAKTDRYLNYTYWIGVAFLVCVWTFCRHSGIIIPLGISFYTFQALSYLTEVYWKEYEAERNYWTFMLYMLLFMKFLSGPIERPSTLLPQLQKSTQFDYDNVILGLKLIMLGLIKKLVLADNLADGIDVVFSCPQDASGLQLLTATLVYPIQLYADFSGYTDMALGAALLFGIKLSPNFDRPFTATTTADLWRKWHMTLSFWVRDYIFMPMSSILRHWNRPGIYLSLLITFAALGVWHGVGWNFVVYGLIQGVIICYEMRVTCIRKAIVRWCGNTTGNLILMFRTYLLFAFSLIFFRAKSMQDAIYVVRHLSLQIHQSWKEMNLGMTDHIWIVCGIAFLLMMIYEYFQSKYNLMHLVTKQPTWVRWSIYYLLIFALLTTGKFDSNDFIYLQF